MKQKNTTRYLENQAIEWLVKLNNPQLTADEEREFHQWLHQSAEHQLAYINAERLWAVSPRAISLDTKSPRVSWRHVLASVFLFVSCSYLYVFFNKTETYELYTGIGEIKEVQLADGSHVKLNNQTHIRFVADRRSRKVSLLAGEALFRVQSDREKPFDVETDDGVVRVVGTYFSVNRYEESTKVTVVEGKVALGKKATSPDKFVASQVLSALQQQSMSAAFAGKKPEIVNPQTELAWQEHRLIYTGAELAKVIRDLERIYPVTIQLNDPALGKKQVTAVLNLSSLDQVLQVLEMSLSLKSEKTGAGIVISEKK